MGKAARPDDAVRTAPRRRADTNASGRGIARTLLALLLLSMAAGQASDPGGFARILDTYRVFPGGTENVATGVLIAGEVVAALALLRTGRWGGALALSVALAWTLLAAQAFARSLTLPNCGCFGVHLAQPLRWWVLLQDAYFLGLALWVTRADRRRDFEPARPKERR